MGIFPCVAFNDTRAKHAVATGVSPEERSALAQCPGEWGGRRIPTAQRDPHSPAFSSASPAGAAPRTCSAREGARVPGHLQHPEITLLPNLCPGVARKRGSCANTAGTLRHSPSGRLQEVQFAPLCRGVNGVREQPGWGSPMGNHQAGRGKGRSFCPQAPMYCLHPKAIFGS